MRDLLHRWILAPSRASAGDAREYSERATRREIRLTQLWISRTREYAADAEGARIAGGPLALASALAKLENANHAIPSRPRPATAHLYIVAPLTGASVARLFATHPPMQERIRRLRAMAA